MDLVVDPFDSTKAVTVKDGRGRLAGSVSIAPVGADINDKEAWTHIGFTDPDGVLFETPEPS